MIAPSLLGDAEVVEFLSGQDWFDPRGRGVLNARVVEAPAVRDEPPQLAIAIVEVVFEGGLQQLYQLPLGLASGGGEPRWGIIARHDGWTVYDAVVDATLVGELVQHMRTGTTFEADGVVLDLHAERDLGGGEVGRADLRTTNRKTTVLLDEQVVLKVYRRLEAGINPELELLRFLSDRGFANIGTLAGWYGISGRPIETTLGVLRRFIPAESDGWTFALRALADVPERFLASVRRLGEVIGSMHVALASDTGDPTFAPEEPSAEAHVLLAASVDEEVGQLFAAIKDEEAFAPVAWRSEEIRERLRTLAQRPGSGRVIRTHGDLHLAEVVWTGDDWFVVDFEEVPGRPLAERRRKRSPLRDVASMLRSFAFAVSASSLLRGVEAPTDWEERAREGFLAGYFSVVEPTGLVPGGRGASEKLLGIFELERALFELRHELDHRPEWAAIPVSAIERLLDEPLTLSP
jgi:trehalose synthase-fused probable maltokinase